MLPIIIISLSGGLCDDRDTCVKNRSTKNIQLKNDDEENEMRIFFGFETFIDALISSLLVGERHISASSKLFFLCPKIHMIVDLIKIFCSLMSRFSNQSHFSINLSLSNFTFLTLKIVDHSPENGVWFNFLFKCTFSCIQMLSLTAWSFSFTWKFSDKYATFSELYGERCVSN